MTTLQLQNLLTDETSQNDPYAAKQSKISRAINHHVEYRLSPTWNDIDMDDSLAEIEPCPSIDAVEQSIF